MSPVKLVNAKQRKVRLYLGHDDNDSNEKKRKKLHIPDGCSRVQCSSKELRNNTTALHIVLKECKHGDIGHALSKQRQQIRRLLKVRHAYLTAGNCRAKVTPSMFRNWIIWATTMVLMDQNHTEESPFLSVFLPVDCKNCCCPLQYSNEMNIRQIRMVNS